MSRHAATLVTLLLAMTVPFGCRTVRKLELTQAGAPLFERFEADYAIAAADFHFDRTFAASQRPEAATESATITTASGERVTSTDDKEGDINRTGQRAARLKIECPASTDTPDEARLTLEIRASTDGSSNSPAEDVRHLIVPRQQIDLLILDLARTGFFDGFEPPGARSPLNVTIDGARVSRNWRLDDRLLDFAHRAFHLGHETSP